MQTELNSKDINVAMKKLKGIKKWNFNEAALDIFD